MTFRPMPGLSVAALISLVILLGLGTWQLQRRTEKHLLLQQIETRQNLAAAPVEDLFPVGDYAAFRHVTAAGVFDHASEVYVFDPRTEDGPTRPGYKVLTPFTLIGGDAILVDRGWVPDDRRLPDTRTSGQVRDQVQLNGVLRRTGAGSAFTPPPDMAKRIFYARDTATISKAFGLRLRTRLLFEATSSEKGGPQPVTTIGNIPDNHLNYALTWFSLAIVLLVVYLRLHYTSGRLRFTP
ncbi:MAG: SURF1 family protein [Micropepsaceae bacterium]